MQGAQIDALAALVPVAPGSAQPPLDPLGCIRLRVSKLTLKKRPGKFEAHGKVDAGGSPFHRTQRRRARALKRELHAVVHSLRENRALLVRTGVVFTRGHVSRAAG